MEPRHLSHTSLPIWGGHLHQVSDLEVHQCTIDPNRQMFSLRFSATYGRSVPDFQHHSNVQVGLVLARARLISGHGAGHLDHARVALGLEGLDSHGLDFLVGLVKLDGER